MKLLKTDLVSGLLADAAVSFLRDLSPEGGGIVASCKPALLAAEFGSDEDALVRLAADGHVAHIKVESPEGHATVALEYRTDEKKLHP